MIDTTNVPVGEGGRRRLRFDGLDAMLADARACVGADARGRLVRRGNWSIGQALNHIAAWIEYPFVGYPPELVLPEVMTAAARAAKARIMSEPMHPGERLPVEGLSAGTLATEDVGGVVGLARLETAAAHLRTGKPDGPTPFADPAFGTITRREWMEMSLRHAELHLSFFVPG
jgi:hypothetical protein